MPEDGSAASCCELPWDEVAVVFHACEQDHVTFLEELCRPDLGDEIDALCRAAREDDLVRAGRTNETGNLLARSFKGIRRAVAQFMQSAVHVRVILLVIACQRRDDLAWFLARGGVVEVHQRLAIDLLMQDGKIGAQVGDVRHVEGLTTIPIPVLQAPASLRGMG